MENKKYKLFSNNNSQNNTILHGPREIDNSVILDNKNISLFTEEYDTPNKSSKYGNASISSYRRTQDLSKYVKTLRIQGLEKKYINHLLSLIDGL